MALPNFERRQFQSFGPNFRIDSGNPNVGFNGSSVYDLYGNTDSGDVSLMGMCQGGIYHFYNDRTIEIIGGQNNGRGSVDVCITGMKGSVVISAMENGDVRVSGKDIIFDAKKNIKFKCGENFTVDAGNKIDLNAKEAYCEAPHSYGPDCIATEDNAKSFLNQVYKGLNAEGIARAAASAAGGPGAVAAVSVASKAISALS
jgi:hypothetical protein|tara:strand:- start:1177 stop:1779 length:603 start_codon:yes stop_codon:yes gene_type:complete